MGSVTQVPDICSCGYALSSGLAVLAGDKVGYMADRSLCLSPHDLDVLAVEKRKPVERRRAPSICLSQGLLLFWHCVPFCIEEFPIMFILLNILKFRILESNQVVRTVCIDCSDEKVGIVWFHALCVRRTRPIKVGVVQSG